MGCFGLFWWLCYSCLFWHCWLDCCLWVGPRLKKDRERFPPNNILLMLAGAGLLWMGWSGFNGGATFSANIESSLAVVNTNVCAATSLLMWTLLDVIVFGKPSVIGAVQGMMTGLVCITPGAGLVQGWAAIVMGIVGGSIPWFTMMIVHRSWEPMQGIDDTLGVFHTHAVSGLLGGLLTGLFAHPRLTRVFLGVEHHSHDRGAVYGGEGGKQIGKQLVGGLFVIGWNLVFTSIICLFIKHVIRIPLRMSEEELIIGDDAAHGEEAYALWADGEKYDSAVHGVPDDNFSITMHNTNTNTRSIGATQVV
ncbi:Ammonium transporter 3 member 1 [Bienertia sinuspersici]